MVQRLWIILFMLVISVMDIWVVNGERDTEDIQFLPACSVNILHLCKCGRNGTFQEVYVESCPVNTNELNFYECLPCPDACLKFSNCLSCSKNQCRLCPPGKTGNFCENTVNQLSPESESLKWSKNQNINTRPIEVLTGLDFNVYRNSKFKESDKNASREGFKKLNSSGENFDDFISSLSNIENWFLLNANITFVDFDNISNSNFSIKDSSSLSDIVRFSIFNDSWESYDNGIALDSQQFESILGGALNQDFSLAVANKNKDSITRQSEIENMNAMAKTEVTNMKARQYEDFSLPVANKDKDSIMRQSEIKNMNAMAKSEIANIKIREYEDFSLPVANKDKDSTTRQSGIKNTNAMGKSEVVNMKFLDSSQSELLRDGVLDQDIQLPDSTDENILKELQVVYQNNSIFKEKKNASEGLNYMENLTSTLLETNFSKNINFSSNNFENDIDYAFYNNSVFPINGNDIAVITYREEKIKNSNPIKMEKQQSHVASVKSGEYQRFSNQENRKVDFSGDAVNFDSFNNQYPFDGFDVFPNKFLQPNEYHQTISPVLAQASGFQKQMDSERMIANYPRNRDLLKKSQIPQKDSELSNSQINSSTHIKKLNTQDEVSKKEYLYNSTNENVSTYINQYINSHEAPKEVKLFNNSSHDVLVNVEQYGEKDEFSKLKNLYDSDQNAPREENMYKNKQENLLTHIELLNLQADASKIGTTYNHTLEKALTLDIQNNTYKKDEFNEIFFAQNFPKDNMTNELSKEGILYNNPQSNASMDNKLYRNTRDKASTQDKLFINSLGNISNKNEPSEVLFSGNLTKGNTENKVSKEDKLHNNTPDNELTENRFYNHIKNEAPIQDKLLSYTQDNLYSKSEPSEVFFSQNLFSDNLKIETSKEDKLYNNTQRHASVNDRLNSNTMDEAFVKDKFISNTQDNTSNRDEVSDVLFLQNLPKDDTQNKVTKKDKISDNPPSNTAINNRFYSMTNNEILLQDSDTQKNESNTEKLLAFLMSQSSPKELTKTPNQKFKFRKTQNLKIPKSIEQYQHPLILPYFIPADLTYCKMHPFDTMCTNILRSKFHSYDRIFPQRPRFQLDWKTDEFPDFRTNSQSNANALYRAQHDSQKRFNSFYLDSSNDEYQRSPRNFFPYINYALQRNRPYFSNQQTMLPNEYSFINFNYDLDSNNHNHKNYEEPPSTFDYEDSGISYLKNHRFSHGTLNKNLNYIKSRFLGMHPSMIDGYAHSIYSKIPKIDKIEHQQRIPPGKRNKAERNFPYEIKVSYPIPKIILESERNYNEHHFSKNSDSAEYSFRRYTEDKQNKAEFLKPSKLKIFRSVLPLNTYSKVVHCENSTSENTSEIQNKSSAIEQQNTKTAPLKLRDKSKTVIRRRRRESDDSWCPILRQSLHGNVECMMWTYKKVCWLECHNGYQTNETSFVCFRTINQWLPPIGPCFGRKENDSEIEIAEESSKSGDSYEIKNNALENGVLIQPGAGIEVNDDEYEIVYYDDYDET